jgi:class 3 adenylate cyclase/tetratricopeptide (TPR) repeat protein
MRCERCTCDNSANSRFCQECGAPLPLLCHGCGHARQPGAKFCGWCGAAAAGGALAPEPTGERKQATVLFADLVGSTELIAGLDAEAAMNLLRPVVAMMAREVRRFDGTILRTLGDGIKAVFGAPRAQEAHALLACQAALAIQHAAPATLGAPKIRIGIHSGEVVAGALDTGSAVEQEAQGMTVHLASRIEQLAEPGDICLSRASRTLVGAYCSTLSLGLQLLRGIPQPVEVYRLVSLRPAIASDQFRGMELARLRGRNKELDALQAALLSAEQGSGSVIGISAPAGIGKSRLCFEFSEWCRHRGVLVLEARGHVFGHATPLQPILEMLRAFLGISPLDPADVAYETLSRRLLTLDPAFSADLPVLCDFLGVSTPAPARLRLDPSAQYTRLRDSLRRMVKAGGRRTSLILFEDVHWLDQASCDFLAAIVEAIEGTHTVMVVNFRPPWSAPWMERRYYQGLSLTELSVSDTRQVVRELVGDATDSAAVAIHVAEQCGGNPFFAEELVLSLAQSGVLAGERGHYRLASPDGPNVALPATVEAVIGARIDGLTEQEKAVLQVGAVIGKEFSLEVVCAVAGRGESELQPLLEPLCAAELLQPRTMTVGAGFAFRHPLIQEVAYGMQLRTRRSSLHAAVAKAIESSAWGQLDEFASLLAYHYEAAGQPVVAATHLERAALWIGKTDSSRALADWKKMRLLLRDQPRSGTNDRLRALASVQILNFGWREGMAAKEAEPYAEEALRELREIGDRRHEPLLLVAYARIVAASGAFDDSIVLIRDALALADANGDTGGIILYNGVLSQIYSLAGLLRDALAVNDAALQAAMAQSQPHGGVVIGLSATEFVGFDVEHWVRCQRTKILTSLGRADEATALLARVCQVEPGQIAPVIQFIPHSAAVELAWQSGDSLAAHWHARQVAEYAEQSGMPYLQVVALGCRALAAATEGNFAAAIRLFRDALDMAHRSTAGMEYEAKHLALLADTHRRAVDFVCAKKVAAEAIEVARRRTDRIAGCFARMVAADTILSSRRHAGVAEARALLAEAERLLAVTGAEFFRPMLQQVQFRLTTNSGTASDTE